MDYLSCAFVLSMICIAMIMGVLESWWSGYGFSKRFYIIFSIVFCIFLGVVMHCWIIVADNEHDYFHPDFNDVNKGEAHIDTIRMTTYYNNGDSAVSVKYVIEWNEKCGNGAAK